MTQDDLKLRYYGPEDLAPEQKRRLEAAFDVLFEEMVQRQLDGANWLRSGRHMDS